MRGVWRSAYAAAASALALAFLAPRLALAQRVHVLAIAGLSGEPAYKIAFEAATSALVDSARARWRVADSSLVVLAEDTTSSRLRARGRSTREEIATAFARLSRHVSPGDVVVVFLVGHGSGEGADSRVSLPGPDATAADFAAWLN